MEKYSPDKKTVIMSRDEVRAIDAWAINTLGVPGVVLMENAGRSCAKLIEEKLRDITKPKVCIFCGTGNNGGDGYVIARHLINSGFGVMVVVCGDPAKIKGDAKINLEILKRMGQSVEVLIPAEANVVDRIDSYTSGADMLVDGLFGTGLRGRLSDDYMYLIENLNACRCPILAVDIPSGLDCDSGEPLGAAIQAAWTVTFVALKKGFASGCAQTYTGEVFITSIGVPAR